MFLKRTGTLIEFIASLIWNNFNLLILITVNIEMKYNKSNAT